MRWSNTPAHARWLETEYQRLEADYQRHVPLLEERIAILEVQVAGQEPLTAGMKERIDALSRDVQHWQDIAAHAPSGDADRSNTVDAELAAMQATLSWRITAPLRSVRRALPVTAGADRRRTTDRLRPS